MKRKKALSPQHLWNLGRSQSICAADALQYMRPYIVRRGGGAGREAMKAELVAQGFSVSLPNGCKNQMTAFFLLFRRRLTTRAAVLKEVGRLSHRGRRPPSARMMSPEVDFWKNGPKYRRGDAHRPHPLFLLIRSDIKCNASCSNARTCL